ncbi:hypothetical protein KKH38_04470 [Patescibacteria group bacterium]|nr:hypothetical protein [Patescibacteria group bacterium]MCG2701480.1 hypothetical protein [Candidatus Parcubacteria bacterium]
MINSKLNSQIKKIIIEKIDSFYEKQLNKISKYAKQNNTGGKIRQAMGDLGEDLSGLAWIEIAKIYSDIEKPIKPKKGEGSQIKCINKNGNEFFAHVDKHCLINGKFILAIEAKSYLDSCYYFRASNDFRLLKMYFDKKLICIVVSIENAIKEESRRFIEDEKWVDKTFILTDGKRSSAKPIWKKEFRKKLNPEKIKSFIEFLDSVFCEILPIK